MVNYPNEQPTRGSPSSSTSPASSTPKTSVVYEFPRAEGDPYYPMPRPENTALYKQYQALADATPDVHFVGRLATYKYYNMDQVVGQALALYARLAGRGCPMGPRPDLPSERQRREFRNSAEPVNLDNSTGAEI